MAWSVVVTVAILVSAWCALPGPRTTTLTDAPTRAPIYTVTPVASPTVFVFASPLPSPSVVLDALPMAPTSTRQPSATPPPTVAPTMTPTQNATPPVQRG